MMLDEAVDKAKKLGHTMISDPLDIGWVTRFSCNKCWKAVLSCEGNIYGSALEHSCNGEAQQCQN